MYVEVFCIVFSTVVLHKIAVRMRSTHFGLTQLFFLNNFVCYEVDGIRTDCD